MMLVSRLLSQALVAFTIEVDNAFEARMPHRTTRGPARGAEGPWLVSLAMWSNFLRYVPAGGVAQADVGDLAALTNLPGLQRWGYVRVAGGMVHPTRHGLRADALFRPLCAEAEDRWERQFGDGLRRVLEPLASPLLPRYLPVAGPTRHTGPPAGRRADHERADLAALLSRVLLEITGEYEAEARLPLGVAANALRVLGGGPLRPREVPLRAGIAKEAAAQSVAMLLRHGLADADGKGPSALVWLTARGEVAARNYHARMARVEARRPAEALTNALMPVVEGAAEAVRPPEAGWRNHPPYRAQTAAFLADPLGALPHHPLVTHRGGFPDGS
ncbi:hypothetical protein [Dactylosporangium sp. CA-139066]|uniref:hypothetical protein n=1 Tax=Dactylosporangium sp. CA-139066 TaxID=3239930 RepID=UPI003D8BB0FA